MKNILRFISKNYYSNIKKSNIKNTETLLFTKTLLFFKCDGLNAEESSLFNSLQELYTRKFSKNTNNKANIGELRTTSELYHDNLHNLSFFRSNKIENLIHFIIKRRLELLYIYSKFYDNKIIRKIIDTINIDNLKDIIDFIDNEELNVNSTLLNVLNKLSNKKSNQSGGSSKYKPENFSARYIFESMLSYLAEKDILEDDYLGVKQITNEEHIKYIILNSWKSGNLFELLDKRNNPLFIKEDIPILQELDTNFEEIVRKILDWSDKMIYRFKYDLKNRQIDRKECDKLEELPQFTYINSNPNKPKTRQHLYGQFHIQKEYYKCRNLFKIPRYDQYDIYSLYSLMLNMNETIISSLVSKIFPIGLFLEKKQVKPRRVMLSRSLSLIFNKDIFLGFLIINTQKPNTTKILLFFKTAECIWEGLSYKNDNPLSNTYVLNMDLNKLYRGTITVNTSITYREWMKFSRSLALYGYIHKTPNKNYLYYSRLSPEEINDIRLKGLSLKDHKTLVYIGPQTLYTSNSKTVHEEYELIYNPNNIMSIYQRIPDSEALTFHQLKISKLRKEYTKSKLMKYLVGIHTGMNYTKYTKFKLIFIKYLNQDLISPEDVLIYLGGINPNYIKPFEINYNINGKLSITNLNETMGNISHYDKTIRFYENIQDRYLFKLRNYYIPFIIEQIEMNNYRLSTDYTTLNRLIKERIIREIQTSSQITRPIIGGSKNNFNIKFYNKKTKLYNFYNYYYKLIFFYRKKFNDNTGKLNNKYTLHFYNYNYIDNNFIYNKDISVVYKNIIKNKFINKYIYNELEYLSYIIKKYKKKNIKVLEINNSNIYFLTETFKYIEKKYKKKFNYSFLNLNKYSYHDNEMNKDEINYFITQINLYMYYLCFNNNIDKNLLINFDNNKYDIIVSSLSTNFKMGVYYLEESNVQLNFNLLLYAILHLKKKGTFLLNIRTCLIKAIQDLLVIATKYFENVELKSTVFYNRIKLSGLYLICSGFKSISKNDVNILLNIFDKLIQNDPTSRNFNVKDKKIRSNKSIFRAIKEITKDSVYKYPSSFLNLSLNSNKYNFIKKYLKKYYLDKSIFVYKMIDNYNNYYCKKIPIEAKEEQFVHSYLYAINFDIELINLNTNKFYKKIDKLFLKSIYKYHKIICYKFKNKVTEELIINDLNEFINNRNQEFITINNIINEDIKWNKQNKKFHNDFYMENKELYKILTNKFKCNINQKWIDMYEIFKKCKLIPKLNNINIYSQNKNSLFLTIIKSLTKSKYNIDYKFNKNINYSLYIIDKETKKISNKKIKIIKSKNIIYRFDYPINNLNLIKEIYKNYKTIILWKPISNIYKNEIYIIGKTFKLNCNNNKNNFDKNMISGLNKILNNKLYEFEREKFYIDNYKNINNDFKKLINYNRKNNILNYNY